MGALSDDAVWRLSIAYIRPKSRTERPRRLKLAQVAHVTRESHHFQGQKVKVTGAEAYCGGIPHSLLITELSLQLLH